MVDKVGGGEGGSLYSGLGKKINKEPQKLVLLSSCSCNASNECVAREGSEKESCRLVGMKEVSRTKGCDEGRPLLSSTGPAVLVI